MTVLPFVLIPDPVPPVIDYLVATPQITDLVGDRIGIGLAMTPVWPAIRVSLLSTLIVAHHRLDRALFQVDCYDRQPGPARRLGFLVRAALESCENWSSSGATLAGSADVSVRIDADQSFASPVYRAAVTAHVYVRPNP